MNISFGKKIPIASCQIINKVTKQQQTAIINEHDCKDISDYKYFANLTGEWNFKDEVALKAWNKQNFPLTNIGTKIYSIETQNGRTIGLMETCELGKICTVEHLESHKRGLYGYTGTNLLAFLSQEKLKENARLIVITNPTKNARKFYKEHCYFKECPLIALELDRCGMKKLIQKAQSKTQSPIIDMEG